MRLPSLALRCLPALCLLFFFGCKDKKAPTWEEHDTALSALENDLKDLAGKIKSAHGEGKCETDSDCRIVGLGHETCGGYRDFLLYSVKDVEEATLLEYVKAFNKKSDKLNDLSLKVPSCGTKANKVKCVEERCYPIEKK